MEKYPPERENGKVEYKYKLVIEKVQKIEHLASQMKYRLAEGGGEAFYILGVTDNGEPLGLSIEEMKKSLNILRKAASEVGATVQILRETRGKKGRIVEVLVRRSREDVPPVYIVVTVLGNVDAGKSTLVGVLCTGSLDNGNGLAMKKVARYLHEIETGRTSSVSTQYLGFDNHGRIVNYEILHPLDEAEIYLSSSKIIALVDLGGHERYLRTTIRGVMSRRPDYAMLVVAANAGLSRMGREHLGVCIVLKIPIFIVVTKIDLVAKEVLEATLDEIYRVLKMPGVSKIPLTVKDIDDIAVAVHHMTSGRVVPIFLASNVTGYGLDLLCKFLNFLPPRMDWHFQTSKPFLMYIEDVFNVRGVGPVVGGIIREGSIAVDDLVQLGPFKDGSWRLVRIRSIQVNRVNVNRAVAGQDATFAISNIKYDELEKGMVLLDKRLETRSVRKIKARITILKHPTTIRKGYQAVLHLESVRSTVTFVHLEKEPMRTGDTGNVILEFNYHPWFIREGDIFVLREARTRAIGRVLEII
ncbi:MAG: hypothetical protein DRJ39_04020 [Thermoprotei archaeon]|nr:GTP-binding protein [Thermoproteales archaeon]RLE71766.1 MAG: hypothetical protein DRZ80_08040 [Thermoprotei archaeon]RLE77708.1 MAG: hypothetical protein DRJ44_01380 [Thermoprotei archaeon]RLE83941.1 MAG: hypothetical protein DRJ39_04020 [Thermoprotei archaeon]